MYQKCSPIKQMKCSQKVAQTNGEEKLLSQNIESF